jgi:hypothetical protein
LPSIFAIRGKAIKTAMYGPLNPAEPNADYWQKLADEWDVDIAECQKTALWKLFGIYSNSEDEILH